MREGERGRESERGRKREREFHMVACKCKYACANRKCRHTLSVLHEKESEKEGKRVACTEAESAGVL